MVPPPALATPTSSSSFARPPLVTAASSTEAPTASLSVPLAKYTVTAGPTIVGLPTGVAATLAASDGASTSYTKNFVVTALAASTAESSAYTDGAQSGPAHAVVGPRRTG